MRNFFCSFLILKLHFLKVFKSFFFILFVISFSLLPHNVSSETVRHTHVSIVNDMFYINDNPTYKGRTWLAPDGNLYSIEGLLINSRMVQGIFDDLNRRTRKRWRYPDTRRWDADRNTSEFIESMPLWRNFGLLGFTLNLQGGSPEGYSGRTQPWHNSTFYSDGSLRPEYMYRLEKILNRADELGMVVILGYFYFGQDNRLKNEKAVINAVDNITRWILNRNYRNIIIEVNNECDIRYDHEILQPNRVHELIQLIQGYKINGFSLYAGTSFSGGKIPSDEVIGISDFILLHGNSVNSPDGIVQMVRTVRSNPNFTSKPILFNEDDNYNFDQPWNNYFAAISEYASWGFFDWRRPGEPWSNGFQSVPVDWKISSERKTDFFNLTKIITCPNP
jgi:hypothetical protein